MTDLTEAKMVEPMDEDRLGGRHILWMVLSGLGIVMIAGAIAGYLAEHQNQGGGPLGISGIIVMGVFAAIIAGLFYAMWRNAMRLKSSQQSTTRREKLNRNIMLACLLLGAATGIITVASDGVFDVSNPQTGPFAVFMDGPMPISLALILVFIWAVVMPVVAWFWHTRAIDEQEASAYRDGGYYAAYAYLILTPTWWLLWRGGLLPEPNGVAIFMIFSLIWSAVWFWKKYH